MIFENLLGRDFGQTWRICEGTNSPRLQWAPKTPGDFACPDGVDISDIAYLARFWGLESCSAANAYCQGADLDFSGVVDVYDLLLFCEHWLTDTH